MTEAFHVFNGVGHHHGRDDRPAQTIGVSVSFDPLIAEMALSRPQVSAAYLIGTLVGAILLLPVGGSCRPQCDPHALQH